MPKQYRRSSKLQAILSIVVALMLGSVMRCFAQSPAPAPAAAAAGPPISFDAVSIHENKSGVGGMRWMNSPDGMTTTNVSLMNLISSAYGIKPDLISGATGWVESTGYDIQAKVAGEDVARLKALTGKERSAMLRPLLAERFHLKVHVVTKTLPVYDLELAKSGPKLKDSTAPVPTTTGDKPGTGGRFMFGPGSFKGIGIGISALADNLSFAVHRTVIDKTGLTGKYDFTLKYAADEHDTDKPDNGETESAPSIFTALEEQLGLKLQASKGPVDTLVIDHVEKPSEN